MWDQGLYALLQEAEPASDKQLALVRGLAGAASSASSLTLLAGCSMQP
jgi:hypothetical protein